MDWRIPKHPNGFLTIFQEKYIFKHSWKIVRRPFACKVVFQSMWKGPNHDFLIQKKYMHKKRLWATIMCWGDTDFLLPHKTCGSMPVT